MGWAVIGSRLPTSNHQLSTRVVRIIGEEPASASAQAEAGPEVQVDEDLDRMMQDAYICIYEPM